MDVCREIAHRSFDPLIERSAECQMPAQTHARRADPAIAVGQTREDVDAQRSVLIVG